MNVRTEEITATAARLVVEEGLEFGAAKRRALKQLGGGKGAQGLLPSNEALEDEVRAYLALFCADTHPGELAALREVAIRWMERLGAFRPHLTGAVWRGTATRLHDVWINLFCDDPKSAEIALINHGVDHDVGSVVGFRGETVDVLTLASKTPAWPEPVLVHLTVYDTDALRGALKPDARGQTDRGDLRALRALMATPLGPQEST